jgi:salicylate hydroxylase
MASYDSTKKPFTIAVVGGGIGGLALTIGLLHQGISVQVYESAPAFAEIGAGIAFGPNSIQAMALIDPAIRSAFTSRATKNGAKEDEETWINFRCGLGEPKLIAKVQTTDQDKTGLSSVHRAHFMDELASLIPKGVAHFGKRLQSLEHKDSGRIQLIFEDGTTAEADAVVGCDGLRSQVRQILFDKKSPLEDLTFSGKYAYRGLIPMNKAKEALGDYLAGNSQMYLGPEGHILTYPIDHGKIMNVIAFKNLDTDWEHEAWVLKNKGAEMKRDFEGWGKPVQAILKVRDIRTYTSLHTCR